MSIYTGPVFEMAKTQFGIIADHLEHPAKRARPAALPEARHHRVHPGQHG